MSFRLTPEELTLIIDALYEKSLRLTNKGVDTEEVDHVLEKLRALHAARHASTPQQTGSA